MAYDAPLAAALSGATVHQLRHWRQPSPRGVVLSPEIRTRPRVLYSFRDLLALRTCVFLRRQVPLQRIRRAIGTLRDLGEVDHLSAYTLVSDRDTIQLVAGDEAVDLVTRPRQGQVLVGMTDVIEPFHVRDDVTIPHLLRPRAHVAVDPETRGGHPVIAGTRVPYDLVAGLMTDGLPAESISDYYPSVTMEAAGDALDFARYVAGYDVTQCAA